MGFTIVNIINKATIDALNQRFNRHYIRTIPTRGKVVRKEENFNYVKRFMEEADEVHYNINTH